MGTLRDVDLCMTDVVILKYPLPQMVQNLRGLYPSVLWYTNLNMGEHGSHGLDGITWLVMVWISLDMGSCLRSPHQPTLGHQKVTVLYPL